MQSRILSAFFIVAAMQPLLATDFYVGTYTANSTSKGIYHASLDTQTGRLGEVALAAEAQNPSFVALTPKRKFLYAAIESASGAVAAYRVETDGRLTLLNQQATGGSGTCHVSVDRSGKFVFVANYGSGDIACFAVNPDGTLGKRTGFARFEGSGPNPARQTAPHAHAVYPSPDGRFVYACDLGTDRIWIFHFDPATGALAPSDPPLATVPGGAGPRHLAFGKDAAFVYVANELGRSVTAFRRDAATGALENKGTVSLGTEGVPPTATVSEIAMHPSGKWLYVASRSDNVIAAFAVASDGKLSLVQTAPAGVKIPRNFAIDGGGRWLIAAGQDDNRLAVLPIDPQTGRLGPAGDVQDIAKPACVVFMEDP
ncbi:MAG: lactonase family protein [Terrimicrobiaceae bacterium]|nr:lactonase family protein [Terrimicrobiaceae bacterium]